MLTSKAAVPLLLVLSAAPSPPKFVYTQDFNGMGTGSSAPAGWTVYSIAGSHDLFRPADDTIGKGGMPTGDGIKGGLSDPILISATPDTSTSQRGKVGFNWAIGGSATERSLGTSPSGNAGMVLELKLTNSGPDVKELTINYDIRVLSTTTNNNKASGNNYIGIEELPGYMLFYSLDNGATYTNIASLNSDGHTWANAIGTVHKSVVGYKLSGNWAAGGTLLLRWFDDNAQSPSPDQKLGLDNVVIGGTP